MMRDDDDDVVCGVVLACNAIVWCDVVLIVRVVGVCGACCVMWQLGIAVLSGMSATCVRCSRAPCA
eukprot:3652537-Pyramimonas_sp.AAC.1